MIVRFRLNGQVRGGSLSLEDSRIVSGGEVLAMEDVELLAPCQPSKIVCVGLNYVEHAKELKMKLPDGAHTLFEAAICRHRPGSGDSRARVEPEGGLRGRAWSRDRQALQGHSC